MDFGSGFYQKDSVLIESGSLPGHLDHNISCAGAHEELVDYNERGSMMRQM